MCLMNSRYVEWLQKQRIPLFKAGDIYWRFYQGALIPAPATPCFVELSQDHANALLKDSGAMFIRYASDPCEKTTEWWFIVCDTYSHAKLSSNTRSKINRGNKRCSVKQIETEWIADQGYGCYTTAFKRYKNVVPISKEEFRNSILKTLGGPFEYWGIFIGDRLVGYCQCIIENSEVSTNVFKFDPSFLKHYTSYALINSLLSHYVVEQHMIVSNSVRSIAHDTNMQDLLLKFGFRKQFCHLNIVYKPWLEYVVQILYPLRKLIAIMPDIGFVHKMQSILIQEELRRTFNV